MRAMGIDLGRPGGVAVVSDEGGRGIWLRWVEALPAKLSDLQVVQIIHRLCKEHQIAVVATEKPGTWGDPRIGMAQRGNQDQVRLVCEALKIPLVDYQPQEIKKAVTGSGRATKEQVGRHIWRLLHYASNDHHVIDACAIALLALNREYRRRFVAGQRPLNPRRRPRKARAR